MKMWAQIVSRFINGNIKEYYDRLVEKGVVQQNSKTELWNIVILSDLLRKGIISNN